MKALDPHRVTTVTDPAVVEIGVTTIDGAAVGDLELGVFEVIDGEVVINCPEEGTLELTNALIDVGIDDGAMVIVPVEFDGVMVISAQFQKPSVSPSGEFPV
jgi:hypothetical protein